MAERLREIRKLKKLTQEDLAKYLNLNQSQIARYEKGELSLNANLIKKICLYFNISADWLLGLKDNFN
ncbi:MAG TPA: helix-turn-helix transcriptional regulator [Acholeplasmataceae bacterium]|nr:helix-turn-helix transcriptional regulator [Acholeplasmataceae bacterium]